MNILKSQLVNTRGKNTKTFIPICQIKIAKYLYKVKYIKQRLSAVPLKS